MYLGIQKLIEKYAAFAYEHCALELRLAPWQYQQIGGMLSAPSLPCMSHDTYVERSICTACLPCKRLAQRQKAAHRIEAPQVIELLQGLLLTSPRMAAKDVCLVFDGCTRVEGSCWGVSVIASGIWMEPGLTCGLQQIGTPAEPDQALSFSAAGLCFSAEDLVTKERQKMFTDRDQCRWLGHACSQHLLGSNRVQRS